MPYCKTCDRKFKDVASIQQHLRTSAAEHPICKHCDKKFTDETAYEQHMDSKHPKRYPCPTHPESIFKTPEALEDHYRGHQAHPNCYRCGKGYLNEELMLAHHDSAHPSELCEMCGRHRLIYHDQRQKHWVQSRWHPTCERCGEGFYDLASMRAHIREGCGREICQACGGTFYCEYVMGEEKLCADCDPDLPGDLKVENCYRDGTATEDADAEELVIGTAKEESNEAGNGEPSSSNAVPKLVIQTESESDGEEKWHTAPTNTPSWPATPFSARSDGKPAPLPPPSADISNMWAAGENKSAGPLPSLQLITKKDSLASRHNLPTLETQGLGGATRSTTVVDHSKKPGDPKPDDPSPNVESPSGLSALPGVSPYPATPSEMSYNGLDSREPRVRSISALYAGPSAEGGLSRPPSGGPSRPPSLRNNTFTPWPMDRRSSSNGRAKDLHIMTPIEAEPSSFDAEFSPEDLKQPTVEAKGPLFDAKGPLFDANGSQFGAHKLSSHGRQSSSHGQTTWPSAQTSSLHTTPSLPGSARAPLAFGSPPSAEPVPATISRQVSQDLPEGMRVSFYDNILAAPLPTHGEGADEDDVSPVSSPGTNISLGSLASTSSEATKAEVEVELSSKLGISSKLDVSSTVQMCSGVELRSETTTPMVMARPARVASPGRGASPLSRASPAKEFENAPKDIDSPSAIGKPHTLRRMSHLPRLAEHVKTPMRPVPSPPPPFSEVLKCRLCARNPCEEPTVTMCGHIFCNKCIVDAIISSSSCPLCSAPQLLYCIFKLRLD
uniref:RING-type domain-containing protein n=1 Tax=Schizophyllum commune (strain H4-8 / FGSC 9210) TaxID=578458 RepID=D8QDS7_SCHCM